MENQQQTQQELQPTKPEKPIWKRWWLWIIIVFVIIIITSAGGGEKKETKPEITQPLQQEVQERVVSEIEVNGKTIRVGDLADDVFEIVTDEYKFDSPTIKNGKITHHFLDGKTLFDMTFERNSTGKYYILTKILIKNTDYQPPLMDQTQVPVQYQVGYTVGYLATIYVSPDTSEAQLTELLNYFHSLHKSGELSKVMKGHTVIDIFDDERWTKEENYNNIIMDPSLYCSYIRAQYSIDLSGIEKASIGGGDCPNYKKIEF